MNKAEKAVEQVKLARERAVLDALTEHFEHALKGINERLQVLQSMPETQSTIYRIDYQKVMQKQVSAIVENLHANVYQTIDQYRHDAYTTGFVGTMYDLHYQDMPLLIPINRDAVLKAVQHDTKLTSPLYDALGIDTKKMSKQVSKELSRGLASGLTYDDIARNIRRTTKAPLSRAKTIARTEGHRIHEQSSQDAAVAAKEQGADLVKQWDATLDGDTRPNHRQLDGQIRELEEPYEVGSYRPMHPGDFGTASEDCNCRCLSLKRARWELDEDELVELKKRAEFFGLDKSEQFEEFERKYLRAAEEESTTVPTVKTTTSKPHETLDNSGNSGIIDIEIDEFTPCLRDTKTGEVVQTRVAHVTSQKVLKQYNEKTGWNVNWSNVPKDVDVYALHIAGSDEVQGLVGIKNDTDAQAVYLYWASTAPRNNKLLNGGKQDYAGVGGHLFAIAAEKSIEMGYGGYLYGFASNKKVLEHYKDKFGAEHIGMLHPYHFAIDEEAVKEKILGVYSYEWE